ncbi:MAG TPA: hypothetical protein VMT79_04280 [Candidatus Binatia bacterium]|jgi:hypothetical protein|nr:hypothetical protein [Candidatus Binatia bacterium]
MQVVAFSTPASPTWRWRIVDYAGQTVEESRETFTTIPYAVAEGAKLLARMSVVDRPVPGASYRPSPPLRRRPGP